MICLAGINLLEKQSRSLFPLPWRRGGPIDYGHLHLVHDLNRPHSHASAHHLRRRGGGIPDAWESNNGDAGFLWHDSKLQRDLGGYAKGSF